MGSTCGEYLNYNNMGGETEVETPVPVDNKVEDTVKTDKEIIAEEEKADKPEKETEETETKEEVKKDEPKRAEPAKPKKPILHTKVWEEDKVYLYQSPRTPQIPSISAQEECKNLVDLVNRMKEKCWGDHWELAIGDKLELNPHIPKPEPEVEGKKEEEEVKDEEKESKEENTTAKEESTELKEEASDKQEYATEKKKE